MFGWSGQINIYDEDDDDDDRSSIPNSLSHFHGTATNPPA